MCLIDDLCPTKKFSVFHYVLHYEEHAKPPYNARGNGGGMVGNSLVYCDFTLSCNVLKSVSRKELKFLFSQVKSLFAAKE